MTDIVLTGIGTVTPAPDGPPFDPTPFLNQRKLRKFMARQDDMAVGAAHRALAAAALGGADRPLGDRAGLYLAVGYTAFDSEDLTPLLDASQEEGRFCMPRFATAGLESINPLVTFRCLPNMPAFHVSLGFQLTGPYFVTYPGPGQLYVALQQAVWALEDGSVDIALVGGVAAQRNFLVEHLLARLDPPVPAGALRDAAGFLILEREAGATARQAPLRGRLRELHVAHTPTDPFVPGPPQLDGDEAECSARRLTPPGDSGAAALPVLLERAAALGPGPIRHRLCSRDGIAATSLWEMA